MSKANEYQVGGDHYRKKDSDTQHWDYATARSFDFFQYQITKYVERWRDKNGIVDLEKAKHFLEKYIEVEKAKKENQLLAEETLKERHGTLQMKLSSESSNPAIMNSFPTFAEPSTIGTKLLSHRNDKPFGFDPSKEL